MKAVIEGLLFISGDEGLTLEELKEILEIDINELKNLIKELYKDYQSNERGIKLELLGNHFKLTTKQEHKNYYQKLIENPETNVLSQAALETLAIIVYNEPITRVMIDEIRGVSSRDMIRKLVAKGLIKEIGRSDMPGRPILYATTSEFLDYFGLASKEELPKFDMIVEENVDDTDLYQSRYQEE